MLVSLCAAPLSVIDSEHDFLKNERELFCLVWIFIGLRDNVVYWKTKGKINNDATNPLKESRKESLLSVHLQAEGVGQGK